MVKYTKSKGQSEAEKIKSAKFKLRKRLIAKLKNQEEVTRHKKSLLIKEKLFALKEFREAKIIMFYASFDGEVETKNMIEESQELGKQIAIPTIIDDRGEMVASLVCDLNRQLTRGPYGIQQPKKEFIKPVQHEDLDLVVVPGVAFDHEGNRLGRGKGYYDKFLKTLPKRTKTVGIAFDFQVLKDLPHIKLQDIPVDKVLFA